MKMTRNKRKQLRAFRQVFLRLTADGTFPPHRQNQLFQACQKVALDWDDARYFIRDDAQALLHRYVTGITRHRALSEADIDEIRRLQRRLGIDPAQPTTVTTVLSKPRPTWPRSRTWLLAAIVLVLATAFSLVYLGYMPASVLALGF
jgi:hypothetical protein